jgi:uncharacterized protein (TIGR02391 family)
LRTKTGLESDGTALVGQALGGKAPKLRLNRLQTESEKSVQAGVEQLLRGVFQALRNPRSHERVEDTQSDADAIIVFVEHLLKLIGHARAAFSIDQAVARVLEEGFVPTERYAVLLLDEIPRGQRLQVGVVVFQRKTEADCSKLRFFFEVLIQSLSEDDRADLFAAISTELRESNDETHLRCTFQLLAPDRWLSIDEAARLRAENRIICNVQEGRYRVAVDKCLAGALATWSVSFWPKFTLKAELLNVVVSKLRSPQVESQDYALKYCFQSLEVLAPNPPFQLRAFVLGRLKAGDTRYKQALGLFGPWSGEWGEPTEAALKSFQAAEQAFAGGPDDDIPF